MEVRSLFHYVEPRDRTQILKFVDKFLYAVWQLTECSVVSLRQMPNPNKYKSPRYLEITVLFIPPKVAILW